MLTHLNPQTLGASPGSVVFPVPHLVASILIFSCGRYRATLCIILYQASLFFFFFFFFFLVNCPCEVHKAQRSQSLSFALVSCSFIWLCYRLPCHLTPFPTSPSYGPGVMSNLDVPFAVGRNQVDDGGVKTEGTSIQQRLLPMCSPFSDTGRPSLPALLEAAVSSSSASGPKHGEARSLLRWREF